MRHFPTASLFVAALLTIGEIAYAQNKKDSFIDALMGRMTPKEKIGQLNLLPAGTIQCGIHTKDTVATKKYEITEQDKEFMREAIRLSDESVKNGGGPFGAVIVKDGKIIAGTSNSVTLTNDPTAHAEVNAIRKACSTLKTFELDGSVIYTSCEPCPMCLGAIYWAHIGKIFYANDRKDAGAIGFDDDFIYKELERPMEERTTPIIQMIRDEALHTFKAWEEKSDKIEY